MRERERERERERGKEREYESLPVLTDPLKDTQQKAHEIKSNKNI